jgi:NAD(P)-dependent dehydrogenase (short-subunit alcohol dehydrogenase family)
MTNSGGMRRTLVLTGASRGIGHATVIRFSSAGWRVITCSRHPFPENCPWEAGPEDHLQVDLADPHDVERGIAELKERLDGAPLNALVNNAGISPKGPSGERMNSLTTPLDTWNQVLQVNFLASILLARGLLDELARGQGSIVNVTSIVGSRVHPFAGAAYATSKAALAGLTREMAADFAPYGVRVNAIAPGEIKTSILSPETEEKLAPTIPMRRLGTPEEVARVIYFLCTDQSSYVNGAEIHINGGQHV